MVYWFIGLLVYWFIGCLLKDDWNGAVCDATGVASCTAAGPLLQMVLMEWMTTPQAA